MRRRDEDTDERIGSDPREDAPIDPELESDLGEEFSLRGDQLLHELEQARAEAAECRDLAQRVQAESENFRKRFTAQLDDERKRAGQRMAEAMLPVLDNLERAIDHVTAGGDVTELLKGVEMVHQQVSDVLGREGVQAIDPFGEPFDPLRHHAVSQREDTEVPDSTVVEVLQKGYEMAGRVIRSAMVVVSTGGPPREE